LAILKIARMGHPILRTLAEPVGDPAAAEITRLVADMWETMGDARGIGLAAPQVHVPLRIVVFAVPAHRLAATTAAPGTAAAGFEAAAGGAAAGGVPPTVLINPEITPLDDATAVDWEACLSVPGLKGRVRRFQRIRYRGIGRDGAPFERIAEGFHARVVQHECDHLDGILYPMRIDDLRDFGFAEEIGRNPPT
jgi:peptide deformylase